MCCLPILNSFDISYRWKPSKQLDNKLGRISGVIRV